MKFTGFVQTIGTGPDPVDAVHIDARTGSVATRNLQRCKGLNFNQKTMVQHGHRHHRARWSAVAPPIWRKSD